VPQPTILPRAPIKRCIYILFFLSSIRCRGPCVSCCRIYGGVHQCAGCTVFLFGVRFFFSDFMLMFWLCVSLCVCGVLFSCSFLPWPALVWRVWCLHEWFLQCVSICVFPLYLLGIGSVAATNARNRIVWGVVFCMVSVVSKESLWVCLHIPESLLGNCSVNTFLRQRRIVGGVVFLEDRLVSEKSRRLVLSRSKRNITHS
jgi:hypothetical protein